MKLKYVERANRVAKGTVGLLFGRLTVTGVHSIEQLTHYKPPRRVIRLHCQCGCGQQAIATLDRLRQGLVKSCGCLQKERASEAKHKHGKSMQPGPIYKAWIALRSRCNNPNMIGYANYGGRGITVDPCWESYEVFERDMAPTWKAGLSVHRLDNDGPYSPKNCIWATRTVQNANTRRTIFIEFGGKYKSIYDWAVYYGLPHRVVRVRWHRGKRPPELFKPAKVYPKRS